ncbi:MAG: CRISPR-associated endonuclease Cas2, partial [Sediminibacterium sp.]|nr:CRISPR-associated endonuclease Cas2 [Sediminibacterium sp.]
MVLFVFYDLPTETKEQRKEFALFRKKILGSGFNYLQNSVYVKQGLDFTEIKKYSHRIKNIVPENGHVVVFHLTDSQFKNVEIYEERRQIINPISQYK